MAKTPPAAITINSSRTLETAPERLALVASGAGKSANFNQLASPNATSMSPSDPAAIAPTLNNKLAGKYLTVALDNESYGLAVLKVREIIRMQKITPVPQMPEFVKGVINLRGRVIPVIDLRVKFGLIYSLWV
jgi:hypothetical protein